MQFKLFKLISNAFDLSQKVHSLLVADTATHVNCNTDINLLTRFHTRENCFHVPATTRRASKSKVTFQCSLDLLTNQFTPVHFRVSQLINQSLNACRQVTCTYSLRSLQNRSLHFVFDLLTFFCADLGTPLAFAFFVTIAFAIARTVIIFQVLIQNLIHQLIQIHLLRIFVEQIVDFFPAHALVFGIKQNGHLGNLFTHALINEVSVNYKVLRSISKTRVMTLSATAQVIINTMQ